MASDEFQALKKQGLRITVDVHALGDDGEMHDDARIANTLTEAIDEAIGHHLFGEYITSLKVTRIVG